MKRAPLNRAVEVRILPGQDPGCTDPNSPLFGTGQVVIHLFVQDLAGPFVEPCVLHPKEVGPTGRMIGQELVARPTRGRLACNSRRSVAPVIKGGVTHITLRTSEPGAVTCPRCLVSSAYKQLVEAAREA